LGPINESVAQFLYDLGGRITSVYKEGQFLFQDSLSLCRDSTLFCTSHLGWRRTGPL